MTDTTEGAISTIADRKRYPNIPPGLVKHVRYLASNHIESRILKSLVQTPEAVAGRIDELFSKASSITGKPPDELLSSTDFHWREKDSSRIEAAFAEIRAINFLDKHRFRDITLLASRRKRKADIRAERCGLVYAIEVADSNYYAHNRVQPEQIANWIQHQLMEAGKSAQLQHTAREIRAAKQAFIAIIDTEGAVPLNTNADYLRAAQDAWSAAGSPPNLHLCVVTGRQALGYPPDDAVFPPWES